ncbi:uncharacterized protein LOC132200532 [Neocloeon triangulifer]|uniref:uncharacterized protein LOC132200532 n=1 Tax=Neocloeon triangulifer TaxID=2078957 RepID=UPI00286EF232|nr:uncharacterized protein LOC132200532 [Neocloeon triangulifer]XP_059482036.1 uncharacterized protein LOC132200532 [Neocloeon triangulifer]
MEVEEEMLDDEAYSLFLFRDFKNVVIAPSTYLSFPTNSRPMCKWPDSCKSDFEFQSMIKRHPIPKQPWESYEGKVIKSELTFEQAKVLLPQAKAKVKDLLAKKLAVSDADFGASDAEQKGRGARTKKPAKVFSPAKVPRLSSSGAKSRRDALPIPPSREPLPSPPLPKSPDFPLVRLADSHGNLPSPIQLSAPSSTEKDNESSPVIITKQRRSTVDNNCHNFELMEKVKRRLQVQLENSNKSGSLVKSGAGPVKCDGNATSITKKVTTPPKKSVQHLPSVSSPSGRFFVASADRVVKEKPRHEFPLPTEVFQKIVIESLARLEEFVQRRNPTGTLKVKECNNKTMEDLASLGIELPLATTESFQNLEKLLSDMKIRVKFEDIVVEKMKSMGVSGSNDVDRLKSALDAKIMPWLFASSLTMDATKCGTRPGKVGMKHTKFIQSLGNACRKCHKDLFDSKVSDDSVLLVVGEFLRKKGSKFRTETQFKKKAVKMSINNTLSTNPDDSSCPTPEQSPTPPPEVPKTTLKRKSVDGSEEPANLWMSATNERPKRVLVISRKPLYRELDPSDEDLELSDEEYVPLTGGSGGVEDELDISDSDI